MLRTFVVAVALSAASAVPALAQPYGYGPPPGAWGGPNGWQHQGWHQREAFRREIQHERWRCNHGDWQACHWLHRYG